MLTEGGVSDKGEITSGKDYLEKKNKMYVLEVCELNQVYICEWLQVENSIIHPTNMEFLLT